MCRTNGDRDSCMDEVGRRMAGMGVMAHMSRWVTSEQETDGIARGSGRDTCSEV